jgi:hypothetical protein
MVPGYPNLARLPYHIWEYKKEDEELKEIFDWFTSSEDNIREEVVKILKEKEAGSG